MSEKNPPQETKNPPARAHSAWFGFASRELSARNTVRIRIRWGRVAVGLFILGIVFWSLKSWGLYVFFKEVRDFEDVSFTEMILFPMNRTTVRIHQGDYQVDQAKAALEREDYRRAYALLREGVARSPANLEGRILLAQIYAGWRPDLASGLLVDGIEHGKGNPDYVKLMCMLLLSQKEDQQILDMTESLLQEDLPAEVRQILSVSRLQSAIFKGDFATVRELFEGSDLAQSMDGVILGTQLYVRIGQAQTAIDVLLSAIRAVGDEKSGPLLNQLVSVYKKLEMYERARELALGRVISNPMDWQPRVMLIDILSASEQYDRRDREIEALLREHRNDEQAMMALSQLCAEYGNVPAASRLYEIALENGYSLSLFSLTLAEALVQDGQFSRAIDLCNELVREDPAWMLTAEASFNAIRSLAYFGTGDPDLGKLYLKNFLDSKRTNVNQLVQAARRFREKGLQEQVLSILKEAYNRDPKNEVALASLIEVEMDLGIYFFLDEHLLALFELRRPEYSTLEKIHDRLQSDRFLFTEDRQAILAGLESILNETSAMDWDIWTRQKPG